MSSRRKPPSWGKLPWGNIGTAPRQRQSAFGKLDWVRRTGHPPGSAPCSHPRVIDRSGEAALLGLAPCADHSLGHSLSMLTYRGFLEPKKTLGLGSGCLDFTNGFRRICQELCVLVLFSNGGWRGRSRMRPNSDELAR